MTTSCLCKNSRLPSVINAALTIMLARKAIRKKLYNFFLKRKNIYMTFLLKTILDIGTDMTGKVLYLGRTSDI